VRLGVLQVFLILERSTLGIPWFGHDVPEGEESLYFGCGYCSTAHPVLDSGYVECDLPINIDSFAWCPITDVLNEASIDIFAVRGDDDPPDCGQIYQKGWLATPLFCNLIRSFITNTILKYTTLYP